MASSDGGDEVVPSAFDVDAGVVTTGTLGRFGAGASVRPVALPSAPPHASRRAGIEMAAIVLMIIVYPRHPGVASAPILTEELGGAAAAIAEHRTVQNDPMLQRAGRMHLPAFVPE